VASVAATQWTTAAAIIGITILRERLRPIQYAGIVVTLVSVSALVIAS
jgi:drug/metabolite transporter (DMT)-like permease